MNFRHSCAGALFVISLTCTLGVSAQQARWAAENDATARYMIDMERQWAESNCTPNKTTDFIAEDFQGTAPDGRRYPKADAISTPAQRDRECALDHARVRYFGNDLAMVYGSEHATKIEKNGAERKRCLVWTDTWLKRSGKWQIIAAQDTDVPCK